MQKSFDTFKNCYSEFALSVNYVVTLSETLLSNLEALAKVN